eukprot:CAMPEP_0185035076 /NCGR_PEP_ID=MMETSP1103-20130426/25776_1 /TAXON_ID=36769 /ORGANISM="Paraphysomonas bandaiensis, Strain Caron Lab Isolate" /LENGTH=308 /DNA_ID=CAMNT_0027571991 /DNA_START=1 /DNA_END=927 /DNA_ORIENTATION=+
MYSWVMDMARRDLSESSYNYKLSCVRGMPSNPTLDPQKVEYIIDNFETRDSDVFVCTYVKAGTTWTQQIIHQLLKKGVSEGSYGESVPWLEAISSDILGPREAPTWTMDKVISNTSARYFKTHASVRDLPRGVANIKVIYVARNPKDTLVSLYHHARNKPEFEFYGDIDTFVNLFISGEVENGSWFTHVKEWYNAYLEDPDNILFLQYENMFQNPTGAIKSIADFVGIEISPRELDSVLEHCSIESMRDRTDSNIGFGHLRQGGYGRWRETLTVRQSERIDVVYHHKMKDSGLKFNFGPDINGVDYIA